MKFSLVICTYMRPKPLLQLLHSVREQTKYPDEILIIDGSNNNETALILEEYHFQNLHYYAVPPEHRGLTRQRNFGIDKVGVEMNVVSFLDDDTVLEQNYFEELTNTFENDINITGVGGVAINETSWSKGESGKTYNKYRYYQFENYVYKEGQRNVVRNYLGLESDLDPWKMPKYSHGRTCGFPPTGKIYEVDLLTGMSFAFRKKVFDSIRFSTYFDGYSLYEDSEFSIRALQFGKNVVNTKVQLHHFHHPSGRPNQYQYGKMVVRNGWYIWRIKNPKPSLKDTLKWHSITLLLTFIRFTNTFTTTNRKQALTETMGRTVGWLSLLWKKPKMQR